VLRNFECLIAQAAGGNPFAIAVDGSTSIQIVPVEKRETGEHDEWDVQV
jgi:antitoxin (DNA-binding transcriptional repressor) of toxin-antitoxin stability system